MVKKFNFLKNFHAANYAINVIILFMMTTLLILLRRHFKITHSEADMYRKAFAKNKYYLKKEFQMRIKKARPQWTKEKHELIFSQLECLQEYSFCKSHAFSYAMLVYILAYYKIYKPLSFGGRLWNIVIPVIDNGHIIVEQNWLE